VIWLDQECEFRSTVEYMERTFTRPEIDPYWLQVPFRLLNATSKDDAWLNVWGEGEQWVREKHPLSLKDNVYGTDRFRKLLHAATSHHFPGAAVIVGMRAEESPTRLSAIAGGPTYKWATWGAKSGKSTNFWAIYDWSARDVWKAIGENGWDYNAHYDAMYRYGVPLLKMRVSNYHHEMSVHALFYLQEIEPETYQKATARISGIATAGHLNAADFFIKDLPFMFSSWREYRDYLTEHLLTDEVRPSFIRKFKYLDQRLRLALADPKWNRLIHLGEIQSILTQDVDFAKLENVVARVPREMKSATREPKGAK
jgi:predicted phosphoadenosine phosphosulfate sulfurtransferase